MSYSYDYENYPVSSQIQFSDNLPEWHPVVQTLDPIENASTVRIYSYNGLILDSNYMYDNGVITSVKNRNNTYDRSDYTLYYRNNKSCFLNTNLDNRSFWLEQTGFEESSYPQSLEFVPVYDTSSTPQKTNKLYDTEPFHIKDPVTGNVLNTFFSHTEDCIFAPLGDRSYLNTCNMFFMVRADPSTNTISQEMMAYIQTLHDMYGIPPQPIWNTI